MEKLNHSLLENIKVKITIILGKKKLSIKEVLNLRYQSVVEFDSIKNPLIFCVNGKEFGTCKLVTIKKDNKEIFGFQIIDIYKKN